MAKSGLLAKRRAVKREVIAALKLVMKFQISAPQRATLRLLRDGVEVGTWENRENALYNADRPGAYRAEAYLLYKKKVRGWIYSNPIYVRDR